ncbi:MAG TPA: ParB/RepB/Spo0J family partition protein [Paraburkholderia sp.]
MNIRTRMAQQTANLRTTSGITEEEVRTASPGSERPKTGPGMAAALAAAHLRIQELEAVGAASTIPVAEIVPNPWQPRRVFPESKLQELAESIREIGLVQPVVVRRSQAAYELVAGERRWRAHKMLNAGEIKAQIIECSDEDMAILALAENMGRDDLSDYEISQSVRRAEREFPNRKRMAEALGMSRRGLYRFFAFEALPDFIKADLDLQPRLLGGSAAEEIANVLKKQGDDAISSARELWTSVVDGTLPEGKYAAAIASQLARSAEGRGVRERSIEKIFAGKSHAGSITKDSSFFNVKIRTGILSEAQETQIRDLISALFSVTSN